MSQGFPPAQPGFSPLGGRPGRTPGPPPTYRSRPDRPAPPSDRIAPPPGSPVGFTRRPRRPRPVRGWRRAVLVATLGLVNLGPSPAERDEAGYQTVVRSPLRGSYKVGVLGKGGVGKTTVAAAIGSLFALLRPNDPVVAVDADTAFGRLASRIDPYTTTSYWDLATDKNLESFTDLQGRIGVNTAGLYVLAGQSATGSRHVLDPALYREAALRLDRHFAISVIDCGSTMDAPVTQEALRDLDALVVVSSPWADGATAAAKTLEWLAEHGHDRLLQRTVVVLNDSDGHADKRTRVALTEQFLRHGQAVIEVPFDPHLRPGGVIDAAGAMAAPTRRKFLQVTALITRYFASRPAR